MLIAKWTLGLVGGVASGMTTAVSYLDNTGMLTSRKFSELLAYGLCFSLSNTYIETFFYVKRQI